MLAAVLTAQAGSFTNLHNFDGGNSSDGDLPVGVVLYNGQLYGTSSQGGDSNNGMVFTLGTNSGSAFTPIHVFEGAPNDGSSPNELLQAGNMFYGTTYIGGTNDNGTIYAINTNGNVFSILRSFTNTPDPQYPQAGLILSGATLYGTSYGGGAFTNWGTVFKIDTNGANFAVLHSFTNSPDGSNPRGRLVLSGATLYGTTSGGGSNNLGTAFKLNTNGSGYSVIYHFSNSPAAQVPYVGLSIAGNTLYGASTSGGTSTAGTLFQLGTNGTGFTIIHNFTNNEGLSPQGTLLVNNNLLYGSTLSQGTGQGGIIFQVATNGANFTVLQNFTNALNGANPGGLLVLNANTLYGTANRVGPIGGGTVYSLLLSPSISSQPQSVTATNGNAASFTVSATDGSPITYQWYFNTSTLLGGQTGATLNLASVNANSAGNYSVVVSDNGGSITSSPATLTVLAAPTIATPPQSLTVTNGNPAAFTVAVNNPGGTPLAYQWYFNTNTLIAGQTNSSYTIPAVTTNNAGAYTVAVANNFGAVTSSPAVLTVSLNSKPVIYSQPQDLIITNGNNATFTVAALGLNPLNYQWYSNSVNTAIGLPMVGKNANPLTLTGIGKHYNGVYLSVVVTNSLGNTTSNPAFLIVVSEPLITSNPQPATVSVGNPATFSVTALGGTHYQWYSNSVSTTPGTLLAGQTGTTYSFTSTTNSNGKYYTVIITNTFGNTTSTPALLTVTALPFFTLQPLSVTITNGSSVTFTSAAAGSGTLAYQWLYQTNRLITGATNTALIFPTANQPGTYSMKVTNGFGAATSTPALLTVVGRPIMLSSAFDPASGSFAFSFVNLAGSTNRLLATTNLADPSAWIAIATNFMATNGIWQFTDTNSAQTNALRLYRFSSP